MTIKSASQTNAAERISQMSAWPITGLPWYAVSKVTADVRDEKGHGFDPGLERSPGVRNGNSRTLAWKTPWTEEPDGHV